ncbi:kinase-like protein [Coniochaeta ligniaria NRRL 30616]|uniref:non-specific serine/threonine protein kinase n=1 Tax=Coniochaeta ligniaria NRRL 30616 TaxID=1408157 RepID=A0A1J7IX82_9PEZI|nr:kinase-like protein [Coniochaeta ligniaria NRRL 30616]
MEEIEDQVAEVSPPPVLYLVPYNKAARQATADRVNEHCRFRMENGVFALYISFANPDKQVFTLGRADCDIFLPDPKGADISKHQCSFINTERGAVLLEDKSSKKNTEPYSSNNGGQTIGFAKETRRVLVARGINNMIGFGRDRYYQFEIHWESDGLYDFPLKDEPYRTGPRKSRQKKYIDGEKVGAGSYGSVWWVMDVHTGGLMAVKKFNNMEGKHLEFATREIANLFRINGNSAIHHDHILEILDYAGGGKDDWGEIFMPLKAGNLKTLVLDKTRQVDVDQLADTVLQHMLLALACIAEHKIVHRDLKPENILWEFDEDGNYHFRLGDFGLSNNPDLAVTIAGTEPFMAPEVYKKQKQTEKVDIWSLFATIVWVKNINNFRATCAKYAPPVIHNWLVQYAAMDQFSNIRQMASMRAKDRPSAKHLLRILAGDGPDELADELASALTLDPMGEDENDPGVGASRRRRRHGKQVAADDEGDPAVPYYDPYDPHAPEWESGDEDEDPAMPYYEPYKPDPENYHWEREDEAGYVPGGSPRAGGAGPLEEVWVKPYDKPYGPPDEPDPDSGTAVPELWTARQLPTQEMSDLAAARVGQSREPKGGKGKGKKKKG